MNCCDLDCAKLCDESHSLAVYFACLLFQNSLKQNADLFEALFIEHSGQQSKQINPSSRKRSDSQPDFDSLMDDYASDKSFRFIRDKALAIKTKLSADTIKPVATEAPLPKLREASHGQNSQRLLPNMNSQEFGLREPKSSLWKLSPKVTVNIGDFALEKVKLLKYLHLLNEDLRLCKTRKSLSAKLSYFLYVYSHFLGVNHSPLYSQYYIKICPEVLVQVKQNRYILKMMEIALPDRSSSNSYIPANDGDLQIYFNEHLQREIFDIQATLQDLFDFSNPSSLVESKISKLPIFFENTYKIMKIIALVSGSTIKGKRYQRVASLEEPKVPTINSPAMFLPFMSKFFEKCDKERFRKRLLSVHSQEQADAGSYKLYDRIFFFMIKNNISLSYIESLIDSCEYFYKSVLRSLHKEISSFLSNKFLPRSAYNLLQRDDLHANQMMSPVIRCSSINQQAKSRNGSHNINAPPSSISVSHPYMQTPNLTYMPSSLFIHANDEMRPKNDTSLLYTPLQKAPSLINPILKTAPNIPVAHSSSKYEHNSSDQMAQLENQLFSHSHASFSKNLHFSKKDALFSEVYRMYDCSDMINVHPKHLETLVADGKADDELMQAQLQAYLYGPLCERLSAFVGRGALDLNTVNVGMVDVIDIPVINTTGNWKAKDLKFPFIFNPDVKEDRSAMNWSDFHNGVATALSIAPDHLKLLDKESMRTWIEYQGIDSTRYDHSGLFFGLALQGFFNCFTVADIYVNFKTANEARIIATIFGLGLLTNTSVFNNMDDTAQKSFRIHIEANYSVHSDVTLNRTIQAASLISMGFYFKGLCKKYNSELLLQQIEAKLLNENNNNRGCHSLAAGFGLGLVNLGRGSSMPSIKDIKIDEKLFSYIKDGSKGSKFSGSDGLYSNSHGHEFGKRKSGYKASNVREPADGNYLLTTPSALVALALTHLKTNNATVANRIEIPNTIYEVINGNPLTVYMRVLARHLIMWDNIIISQDFVSESIPELIRFLQEKSLKEIAEHHMLNSNFDEIDFHNLSIIYYNAIAATLHAMALKYAGTGDETLKSIIFSYIRQVEDLKIIQNEFCLSQANKNCLDIYSYYSLLSMMCLSLGILMAGRCDLNALKVIKEVTKRLRNQYKLVDTDFDNSYYGFFMALNMAIGFTFLGNGSQTFGNSDTQVACLLISTYPVFPTSFTDNRYHLQVFRHLYVLATEKK